MTISNARAELEALLSGNDIVRAEPPMLLPATDYFDLAGEEFGRRLLLTTGVNGVDYCLRPDFTLPIAQQFMAGAKRSPTAFGYLGKVFRQRAEGPSEFTQAGLELLAQADGDAALDRVFEFAAQALTNFGVTKPSVRIGSVALFEHLLINADMPAVWVPRLRHRFGHPKALRTLLDRLANPHSATGDAPQKSRLELTAEITEKMLMDGFSLTQSRQPEEIADRFLEKQELAAAQVPAKTLALLNAFLNIAAPVDVALPKIEHLLEEAGILAHTICASILGHANAISNQIGDAKVVFDAGFSPRLHYYTGLVFQISGSNGATLVSGGQYDRLMQSLGAKEQITAAGCALWVERLEQEAAK